MLFRSDLVKSLGLSQLKRLDKIIERRRELAQCYFDHFSGDTRIIPPRASDGHVYHLFVIRLSNSVKARRDTFRNDLAEIGIGTQVHYRPLHRQPIVAEVIDSDPSEFPNADWAWERMLSIPLYCGLTDGEQKKVMQTIDKLLDRYVKNI